MCRKFANKTNTDFVLIVESKLHIWEKKCVSKGHGKKGAKSWAPGHARDLGKGGSPIEDSCWALGIEIEMAIGLGGYR